MTDSPSPTMIGIDDENKIGTLDNSSLDIFRLCPQKAYQKIVMGRVGIDDADTSIPLSLDLSYGLAWHEAMNTMYDHGLDSAIDVWRDITLNLVEDPKSKKTLGRGERDLRDYWTRYEYDMGTYDVLGIEEVMTLEMDVDVGNVNWKLRYIGAIDKILGSRRSNEIRIRDHKTAGYINMNTAISYMLSFQLVGYGAILDANRVEYDFDLLSADADIVGITRTKPPSEFLRPELMIDDDIIAEWKCETTALVRAFLTYHAANVWPRTGREACMKWNRPCEYFNICTSKKESREFNAERLTVIKRWDPSDRPDFKSMNLDSREVVNA